MTITVSNSYDVAADQNLTFSPSNPSWAYDITGTGSLTVEGSVTVNDNGVQAVTGVHAATTSGFPSFTIQTGGSFTVNEAGSGEAVGFSTTTNTYVSFTNAGTLAVSSNGGQAIAASFAHGGSFFNSGTITDAIGSPVGGVGIYMYGGGSFGNTGDIIVSGNGGGGSEVDGVLVTDFASSGVSNSGHITVTDPGGQSTGIKVTGSSHGSISNDGVISAFYAIDAHAASAMAISNTGTLDGDVLLSAGSSLTNSGAIQGRVFFFGDGSTYDGRGSVGRVSSLTGAIAFNGSGSVGSVNVAYLGNDGERVSSTSGANLTVYGGTGSDTIAGGAGNDRLGGGGGNDALTGGLGADIFVMAPTPGAVIVTDFSHAQGDKIDLSAFDRFSSLSQVIAVATTSGSDTVLDFGGGSSLTLRGVVSSSLVVSDFVFSPVVVSGTSTITLDASFHLTATSGYLARFTDNMGGTLINQGSLDLTTSAGITTGVTTVSEPDPSALFVNDGSLSVTGPQATGIDYATTHNTGSITVTGTSAAQTRGTSGDLVNSGTFTTQGLGVTYGVYNYNSSGIFQNSAHATVSATSTNASATGVYLVYGHDFENGGQITVSAASAGVGVFYEDSNPATDTVTNSGVITVNGSTTTGVHITGGASGPAVAFQNSGTITAQTAILYDVPAANITNTNTGVINGAIILGAGNDTLTNAGTINGAVDMGGGNNTLDSHAGAITGTIKLGSGSSTAILGADDNTVALAAGTHVVDGGGGSNTVTYANATAGVTVSLAIQGLAQNTGVGTDTLSNFQNLVGSAFNDMLTAGAGAESLTGGAGADTFVLSRAVGSTTITDFSHAQGDQIDLSAWVGDYASLQSFDITPAGSDTVIYLGGGATLTLAGVTAASLQASDFILIPLPVVVTPQDSKAITAVVNSSDSMPVVEFTDPAHGGTFTNNGSISKATTATDANVVVGDGPGGDAGLFINNGYVSLSGIYGDVFDNISVTNTEHISASVWGGAGISNGNVVNSGTIDVHAIYNTAAGVSDYNLFKAMVVNQLAGEISATSVQGGAVGVSTEGGEIDNAGTITASGIDSAVVYGVYQTAGLAGYSTSYALVNNSGSISVTGAQGVGVFVTALLPQQSALPGAADYNLINSGTITAQTAIRFDDAGTLSNGQFDHGVSAHIDNSGLLNGAVILSAWDDIVHNTGTINGAIDLGGGNDSLDSRTGVITGIITVGAGSSTVLLGVEDNTVVAGNGAETLDGGGGVNSLSYSQASFAVAISLALSGQAQANTIGVQQISHFQNLTGSAFNDTLEGDGGDNVLDGAAGVNTVSYAHAASGVTVSLAVSGQQDTIGAGHDTLSNFVNLTGSAFNDHLTGDAGDNVIDGGAGDDVLDGAGGVNTASYASAASGVMVDLHLRGQSQDTVGAGHDTLSNFANLTGSAFNDVLTGDGGANVISGGAGNDTIDGGGGADTLMGGVGNDTYIVNNAGVAIVENANEGVDLVKTSLAVYTLAANLENLTFTGSGAFTGAGNALDNTITGSAAGPNTLSGGDGADHLIGGAAADTLNGGAGNDYLDGKGGNDTFTGGLGADTFILDATTASGVKEITDFHRSEGDVLSISGPSWATFADLTNAATDYAGGISIAAGNGTTIRLDGVTRDDLAHLDILVNGKSLLPPAPAGDANGDGVADITWINQNGTISTWDMSQGKISSNVSVAALPTGFTAIDRGHDFTHDGQSDALMRNPTTGAVMLHDFATGFNTALPAIDLGWGFQGVGDFNGDGGNDILWRHQNGDVSIWLMNGTTVMDSVAMPKVDNSWQIQGLGDFNGDGKTDVLWRNVSGQVVFWEMDGAKIIDNQALNAQVDLNWHVAGLGDFNGDGKTDIVWRHNSGFTSLWTMDSYNIADNTAVAAVDNTWKLEAIGDYNGDGKSDLLWRNGDFVAQWQMDGSHIANNFGIGNIDPSWSILGGPITDGHIV